MMPREARLRPEYSGLYPTLKSGQWEIAAVVADRLLAESLLRGRSSALQGRLLRDDHFDFRGGTRHGGQRAGTRCREVTIGAGAP